MSSRWRMTWSWRAGPLATTTITMVSRMISSFLCSMQYQVHVSCQSESFLKRSSIFLTRSLSLLFLLSPHAIVPMVHVYLYMQTIARAIPAKATSAVMLTTCCTGRTRVPWPARSSTWLPILISLTPSCLRNTATNNSSPL